MGREDEEIDGGDKTNIEEGFLILFLLIAFPIWGLKMASLLVL